MTSAGRVDAHLVGREGVEDVGSCLDELVGRVADGLGLCRTEARLAVLGALEGPGEDLWATDPEAGYNVPFSAGIDRFRLR